MFHVPADYDKLKALILKPFSLPRVTGDVEGKHA